MKSQTFIKIMAAAFLTALLPSCEDEPIMFDSSMNVVGFAGSELKLNENQGTPGSVTLYLGAALGSDPTTVTFEADTAGLKSQAAKPGIDFSLESTTAQLEVGENTVNIVNIVNNDQFTGDKKFYLVIKSNSKNYKLSAQKRILVIIADDEHPLKNWIGVYTVEAASYGKPGEWDELWTVETKPVEGDITKLSLEGISDPSSNKIYAVLNTTAMTITITGGQDLGDPYGAGPIKVYKGDALSNFILDEPITGVLQPNGNMNIDFFGLKIMEGDYAGPWDVFNTTWIKE